MAELSKFWDYASGDPTTEYPSHEFAEYFERFLTNGIYADPDTRAMGLKVSMSGMSASVGTGFALMKGRLYENNASKVFTVSKAPTVAGLARIDRIVLRLNVSGRKISAELKKGAEASSPAAPALTKTSDIYEIPLAQIRINANTSTGVVTDERQPVSSLIKIPLAEFRDDFSDWLANNTTLATDQRNAIQLQFDAWFDTTQSQIDEITEISLQAGIDANSARLDAVERDKMEDSRIHISAAEADASQMQDGDIWIRYE